MPDNKAIWEYPLIDVTESKRTSRTGVAQDGRSAYEVIGVDATTPGGLRPYYGFKRIAYLEGAQASAPMNIYEVYAFDVREGEDGYAYGFVSRVDNGDNSSRLQITYWFNTSAVQRSYEIVGALSSGVTKMEAVISGRFIIILMEGVAPILVYFDTSISINPIVIMQTGPGTQPELIAYDQNVGWGGISTTNGAPGRGQIILTSLTPATSGFWADPPQEEADVRQLAVGSYAFAFRLYNSQLGRWSALSTIAPVNTSDFTDTGSDSSNTSDDTSVTRYAVLDLLYEKTNAEIINIDAWDYAIIYRSVRVEGAGGTTIAAILHADKLVRLADYEIDTQPSGDFKRARVWYELDDKELIFQLPYTDSATFEAEMPTGSTGLAYEGTLLMSGIRGTGNTPQLLGQGPNKGLGEIRWSSLVETSPELFPPFNRYVPSTPSNEVIRFLKVTGQAVAFSADRQYHIRKESIYLRVMEMHEGFGLVNYRAATSVGSLIYFLTHKGVKVVDPQGKLEALESLDQLILSDWQDSYLDVQFAYDAASSVLYMLNPTEKEAALIWFNSSSISELKDMNFAICCEGKWPASNVAGQGNLISRAFFIDVYGRICVPDYRRSRVVTGAEYPGTNGNLRTTMMDLTGDGLVRVEGVGDDFTSPPDTSLIRLVPGEGRVLEAAIGLKVYKANLAIQEGGALLRSGAYITEVYNDHYFKVDGPTDFQAGDYLWVSPIYLRWTGAQLGLQDENGATYGPRQMHRVRHVDSLQVVTSDVRQTGLLPFSAGHFSAYIWRSNESTPFTQGVPLDREGNVPPQHHTITNDPPRFDAPFGSLAESDGRFGVDGTILFPCVEVILSDVDYRILSVRLKGSIRESERTDRTT